MTDTSPPLVGIVMGSKSDWPTMKMAAEVLEDFQIPHERRVVSAHRTPQWMAEYAETAESRGIRLIIAGAGGADDPAAESVLTPGGALLGGA